jgi:galactitol-specific phosphotransferase system IIB component
LGEQAQDPVKREKIKQFAKENNITTDVAHINMDDLKKKADGEDLMGRIKYRKDIALAKSK